MRLFILVQTIICMVGFFMVLIALKPPLSNWQRFVNACFLLVVGGLMVCIAEIPRYSVRIINVNDEQSVVSVENSGRGLKHVTITIDHENRTFKRTVEMIETGETRSIILLAQEKL